MTYIIGDVHGHFDTLKALISKLPKNSEFIFVGDFVDRGLHSKEVMEFIRTNNYKCVLGNHEKMMIDYGTSVIKNYPKHHYTNYYLSDWLYNGGKQTLISYGIASIDNYDKKLLCVENKERFEAFKSDIEFLKTLPYFIELPIKKDGKPIVISHASMADIWHLAKDEKKQNKFEEYVLWNRKNPKKDVEIFNIFGHTPIKHIDTSKHFINVDTGCYIKNKTGYGRLSAYCIETNEIISENFQL